MCTLCPGGFHFEGKERHGSFPIVCCVTFYSAVLWVLETEIKEMDSPTHGVLVQVFSFCTFDVDFLPGALNFMIVLRRSCPSQDVYQHCCLIGMKEVILLER